MTRLATKYLGLELDTPLVVAASPLSRDTETVRQLADQGAGAIVVFSLFEEQFHPQVSHAHPSAVESLGELASDVGLLDRRQFEHEPSGSGASEAVGGDEFLTRPHDYLQHLSELKEAVSIPIIASLNASEPGEWLRYVRSLEHAGADAIELDIYHVASDPGIGCVGVEDGYLEILRCVCEETDLPVALKVGPYFSSFASLARRFGEVGAAGLVLFNRFYQPDIDIESRSLVTDLKLSSSEELRLAVTWIAMIRDDVACDLAATGGVHTVEDLVKALMAGANVVQLCSTLLEHGVERLGELRAGLDDWLARHGHDDVEEVRGVLSRSHYAHPENFARAGYAKVLSRYW